MKRARYQGMIGDRPIDIPFIVSEAGGLRRQLVQPTLMDRVSAYLRSGPPEVYQIKPSDIPTYKHGGR